MPAMGKELEHPLSADEIALREIQGYIDKVERQAETQQPQNNRPQPAQPVVNNAPVAPSTTTPQIVPADAKPKIVLPLNQTEMESGLKMNVINSVRWLSEWCV